MTARPSSRSRGWAHELVPVLNLVLFTAALAAVDRVLRDYRLSDLDSALARIHPLALVGALVLAALGYLALVGYDHVAFRILGRPLSFRTILMPSFVSFAVSASAPGSIVTGGGVRYHMYRDQGVSVADATGVAVIDAVSWLLGFLILAGAVLVARPLPPALAARLPNGLGRGLGVVLLALAAGYFVLVFTRRRPIRMRELTIPVATPGLAFRQLVTSLGDWLFASGALYLLLASVERVAYLDLLTAFMVAQAGSLLLPVPGGVGVFEAVVLLLRPEGVAGPSVLAALLVYRVVYYLLPLAGAGILVLRRRIRAAEGGNLAEQLAKVLGALAPHILAVATFLSGATLFLTGTVPVQERRLDWLRQILPLRLIDASQFLASVVGAALLVVAWGLERRVRLAYRVAVTLFGLGILLALARSMDLSVALLMSVTLGVMLLSNRAFPERRSLLREGIGPAWMFAIGAALSLSVWMGGLRHRYGAAMGETWWHFTLFSDAPAYLRAAVGGAVALLLVGLGLLVVAGPRSRAGRPPRGRD